VWLIISKFVIIVRQCLREESLPLFDEYGLAAFKIYTM